MATEKKETEVKEVAKAEVVKKAAKAKAPAAKKTTAKKAAPKKAAVKVVKTATFQEDLSWVLIKPTVTEKSAILTENNVYTFDVATRSNKVQIKKVIKNQYGVTPRKVNIINRPNKVKKSKFGTGVKSRNKKALVFLKKGDTISF